MKQKKLKQISLILKVIAVLYGVAAIYKLIVTVSNMVMMDSQGMNTALALFVDDLSIPIGMAVIIYGLTVIIDIFAKRNTTKK